MTPSPKARVARTRSVHMYAELWHASECVLNVGRANAKGSSWQFLSSLVLTAFAFEAYLNHVGEQLLGCWPAVESLSPMNKFELICNVLVVSIPGGKGCRPLQTITELQKFRNTMAHGKSEILSARDIECDLDRVDEVLGQRPLAHWQKLIQTPDFAIRAREDVERVLSIIHNLRPEPKESLFAFGIGSGSAYVIPPHKKDN